MPEESAPLWRITNWNERFENHHSRPLKSLSWLHFPLDQDDGYADLMDHPEGTAHLGAWIAIVLMAARGNPRGTLRRGAGIPHTCASMARESRADARIIADCLPRLVRIGWIEDISNDCNATRESRADAPSPRENPAPEERRIEEKREEERSQPRAVPIDVEAILRTIAEDCPDQQDFETGVDCAVRAILSSANPETTLRAMQDNLPLWWEAMRDGRARVKPMRFVIVDRDYLRVPKVPAQKAAKKRIPNFRAGEIE